MILMEEKAKIIQNYLNDILENHEDNDDGVIFYITSNTQDYYKFNRKPAQYDGREYIPGIIRKVEPYIPRTRAGTLTEILTVEFNAPIKYKRIIEQTVEIYKETYRGKTIIHKDKTFTQYIGGLQYQDDALSGDGLNERHFQSYFSIEWDTLMGGITFEEVGFYIDDDLFEITDITYRNDKGTVANREYNNEKNKSTKLVAETLVITFPINSQTSKTRLWRDINTNSFNRIYTIKQDMGAGGVLEKSWELKSGIWKITQGTIITATAVFTVPQPRIKTSFKAYGNYGEVKGDIPLTSFTINGVNILDTKTEEGRVKAFELRESSSYAMTFLHEPGNPISDLFISRLYKRERGERIDIHMDIEGFDYSFNSLVIQSVSHSFSDNGGLIFSVQFTDGVDNDVYNL